MQQPQCRLVRGVSGNIIARFDFKRQPISRQRECRTRKCSESRGCHCEALAPWQSRRRNRNVCPKGLPYANGIAALRSQ